MTDANEVGMGAPTSGTLLIKDIRAGDRMVACLEDCSPSFVWSSDSTALAVPRWTPNRKQKLLVVAVPSGAVIAEAETFRVLELHEFSEAVVRFVDSPIYMPKSLQFALNEAPKGEA
jgi:hypothetical protein